MRAKLKLRIKFGGRVARKGALGKGVESREERTTMHDERAARRCGRCARWWMSLSHKSLPVSSGTAARSSRHSSCRALITAHPRLSSLLDLARTSPPPPVAAASYLATNPDYILPLTLREGGRATTTPRFEPAFCISPLPILVAVVVVVHLLTRLRVNQFSINRQPSKTRHGPPSIGAQSGWRARGLEKQGGGIIIIIKLGYI